MYTLDESRINAFIRFLTSCFIAFFKF